MTKLAGFDLLTYPDPSEGSRHREKVYVNSFSVEVGKAALMLQENLV
jgi:hypothetical protein